VKFICGKSATSNGGTLSPISSGKLITVVWPAIAADASGLENANRESQQGRLTQENHISTLALLNRQ
jgi:hypothetical protein